MFIVRLEQAILELKSIQSDFLQPNYVQIISYLKLWQKHLGLLNFGLPKAKIKRIPFTEKEKIIIEDYDHIKQLMDLDERGHLTRLREAILSVFQCHGLGFGENIYQDLIKVELDFRNINFQTERIIPVEFSGQLIRNYKMKIPIVENKFLCAITAIHNRIDFYDIARLKTYMRALGLKFGLVINFGKQSLEINGVSI